MTKKTKIKIDHSKCGVNVSTDPRDCRKCLYVCELHESEGVHFTIKFNPSTQTCISFLLRMKFDEMKTSPCEIVGLLEDQFPITIDAALKLEGEDLARVSEGTGAAIGDPGPEKYAIENAATENNIAIEAIVIKQDEAAAVGVMEKRILDSVPEVIARIKESIRKRTKPVDKIILAGIGNTIGIGL